MKKVSKFDDKMVDWACCSLNRKNKTDENSKADAR